MEQVEVVGKLQSFEPIAALSRLKMISMFEKRLTDFSPLANCAELENARLYLDVPWPDVRALSALPSLRSLVFHGNLLALQDVTTLPAAEQIELEAGGNTNTPLRDLRELPEMPRVHSLRIAGVTRLDGIERYAPFSLDLDGSFVDLTPLARCTRLTRLRLKGEAFEDLTPLAQLPALRELWLERDRGLDLAPLTDAPQLREVRADGCKVLQTELATCNALLHPWADDFLLAGRSVGPLRFFRYDRDRPEVKALEPRWTDGGRKAFYGDDEGFAKAEARFMELEVRRRMDALLGPGWIKRARDDRWDSLGLPGHEVLTFERYQDCLRVDEIVRVLHRLLGETRFPWALMIWIRPHGDLDEDMEDIRERSGVFDVEREKEEWADEQRQLREREEFLEREHRLRLLREQTDKIDPAEFSPSKDAPERDPGRAGETDESNLVSAPRERSSLGERLEYHFSMTVDGVWMNENWVAAAAEGLDVVPEDWHALPEPPDERPRPPPS